MKKLSSFVGLAFLFLLMSGAALADEIKVLEPKAGDYKIGTAITIKWDYLFMEGMPQTAAEKRMRIELLYFIETGGPGHGGGKQWTLYGTLAEVDVLSVKYVWTVPLGAAGPNRVIRITMVSRPSLTAMSEAFSISKLNMPKQPVQLAAILISSPEAGKTYYIGDTVTIRWSTALIQDNAHVWLFICWPDRTTCGGGFSVSNSGSYEWTINEPEEHDLVVKILSHDEQHVGYSGVFHVKKKIRPIQKIF
ncbi:MAG: hypothetical protein WCB96_12790 [Candidatus Aminicenantales bacterium]